MSKILSKDLNEVEFIITSSIQNKVGILSDMVTHIIRSGGRRLRPSMTLLFARLFKKYNRKQAIKMAAAIELIHTATLFHDDVVDASLLRRNHYTANHIFGNKMAVLGGDFLLTQAFDIIVQESNIEILKLISETTASISEGEILQLQKHGVISITYDTYVKIIKSKTAKLFSAAAEIGAIVGGANDKEKKWARNFGLDYGLAYQLINDYDDYFSNIGKAPYDDFAEGKITLPVLFLYQEAKDDDKQQVKEIFAKKRGIRMLLKLMKKYDVKERLKLIINEKCYDILLDIDRHFTKSSEKDCLLKLVSLC